MTTIIDLPDEIHLLIAEHLKPKAIYSCIRVNRSLHSSYLPCLWSFLNVRYFKGRTIDRSIIRANAHRVETVSFAANLTEEYYRIVFPRLHTMQLVTFYGDDKKPTNLPIQKVHFVRHHPFVRKLVYEHNDTLPSEFWEVVGTEWTSLEELVFEGVVGADSGGSFWTVCERVKTLYLQNVNLPECALILSMRTFPRLQSLSVIKYRSRKEGSSQRWALQLLERVKKSQGLRCLKWDIQDFPFPVRMIQEAFAEDEEVCWPVLCELNIRDPYCTDLDMASILRTLPSQRLTRFSQANDKIGSLVYTCLRDLYFGHLTKLDFRRCCGTTSAMVQEMLMGCTHLVHFDAPYVFVRDIATASKPWACLGLERLTVYIIKKDDDEVWWEGQVFEQISKLRRLLALNLELGLRCVTCLDTNAYSPVENFDTLDLSFRQGAVAFHSQTKLVESYGINMNDRGGGWDGGCSDVSGRGGGIDIRCWSSLVQLQEFTFEEDRQMLGMEEAMWITEHWRDLWYIIGEFKGVEGDDKDELERLFKKKGIAYFR